MQVQWSYCVPDFDISDVHTMMVKKVNNNILVLLDNYLLYKGETVTSDIKLGLICCGSARFLNIKVTQL